MNPKFKLYAIGVSLLLSLPFILSSCKKDKDKVENPPIDNEGELITTMSITFMDSAGIEPTVTAVFKDADGPGGNNPSRFDSIYLKANTTYLAEIILLDESKSPIDTISNEVREEAGDHLFCFTPLGLALNISRTDSDGTFEVGLESKWKTGGIGTGTVQVTLKHQPGLKNGTCSPGETDIEVLFNTFVE